MSAGAPADCLRTQHSPALVPPQNRRVRARPTRAQTTVRESRNTGTHPVSGVFSSPRDSMSSSESRTHDRIRCLGLLAVLLAAACGSSGTAGPGTPDPVRTYRIRRVADSPVARTGHVAIGLVEGSALVMGGNSSDANNVPDSSRTQRFDKATE